MSYIFMHKVCKNSLDLFRTILSQCSPQYLTNRIFWKLFYKFHAFGNFEGGKILFAMLYHLLLCDFSFISLLKTDKCPNSFTSIFIHPSSRKATFVSSGLFQ